MTVGLHHAPDGAEIAVGDDHRPIPAVEANVLTGDHDMADVYHSSGLGFWLVYWSVELSGGTVEIESGDNRGNEITIRLPASGK